MKENTKFLWMYVAILFSFAIILIIFAGLSRNNTTEQNQGLKSDITELSKKNTELQNINAGLQKQLDAVNEELLSVKSDCDKLRIDTETKNKNDELLMEAIKAYNGGNFTKSKQIKSTIDSETLTEAQLYIYNKLVY